MRVCRGDRGRWGVICVVIYYHLPSNTVTQHTQTRILVLSKAKHTVTLRYIFSKGYTMTRMIDILPHQTNHPMLGAELGAEIAKFSKGVVGQDKKLTKVLDMFKAGGFKSTDLISNTSKGSTATEEMFTWCKQMIASGFPAGVKELCELSPKAAGDKVVDGRNRSYWARQPNSIIGGLQTQLKNREQIDAEIASGKQGADARTRSSEAIAKGELGKVITRLQKAEVFETTMDLDVMISQLQAMVKSIR